MQSDGWADCLEIFNEALEQPAVVRASYLERACAGNDSLRRRVELLLESHEEAGDFIQTPAFETAPEFLAVRSGCADWAAAWQLPHRCRARHWWNGRGLPGLRRATWPQGRTQAPAAPLVADETQLERLKREARTASSLNHPNIVTIHEIGEVDGTHYIATEFIEGTTLRERMTRGPIPPNEALEIAAQVANALCVAHAAGIVHRDIKPENIMLRPDGYVKVLDFGIAKFSQKATVRHAPRPRRSTGMLLGTTRYMSPEQARGLAVDARTDIWSLGVVLYEMVAGQEPFTGATPTDVIISIAEREPGPLAKCAPEVPVQLQRTVQKALAKDREERHQTANDLLADLKSLTREWEKRHGLGLKKRAS